MATRTISNTGGNYNATGTWVEGAVPTSADDVVATATSGQLTVNVASAARTIDLTNYSNTITVNASWTISGASLTNTIPSTVTWAGSSAGSVVFIGAAATIVNNSTSRIVRLSISAGTKTITGTLYCIDFISSASLTLNGGTIDVSGNLGAQSAKTPSGAGYSGTTKFKLTGSGWIDIQINGSQLEVDTSGTYYTVSSQLQLASGTFSWINGTNGTFSIILQYDLASANTIGLDLGSKVLTNLFVPSVYASSLGTTRNLNLNIVGTSQFTNLGTFPVARPNTTDSVTKRLRVLTGGLSASNVILAPTFRSTSTTGDATWNYTAPDIQLNSDNTHTFGDLMAIGSFGGVKPVISSLTASTNTNINLVDKETSQIVNYDFTDITSTGEQIVAIGGTLTRTSNITTTYPSGGAVSGGSWTFVN